MELLKCCYLEGSTEPCQNMAEYRIKPESNDPYDETRACEAHVGKLLSASGGTVWMFGFGMRVFLDGNAWCALSGPNLQEGRCGFGATPREAWDAYVFENITLIWNRVKNR